MRTVRFEGTLGLVLNCVGVGFSDRSVGDVLGTCGVGLRLLMFGRWCSGFRESIFVDLSGIGGNTGDGGRML